MISLLSSSCHSATLSDPHCSSFPGDLHCSEFEALYYCSPCLNAINTLHLSAFDICRVALDKKGISRIIGEQKSCLPLTVLYLKLLNILYVQQPDTEILYNSTAGTRITNMLLKANFHSFLLLNCRLNCKATVWMKFN